MYDLWIPLTSNRHNRTQHVGPMDSSKNEGQIQDRRKPVMPVIVDMLVCALRNPGTLGQSILDTELLDLLQLGMILRAFVPSQGHT